jgi:hypothetical protein
LLAVVCTAAAIHNSDTVARERGGRERGGRECGDNGTGEQHDVEAQADVVVIV